MDLLHIHKKNMAEVSTTKSGLRLSGKVAIVTGGASGIGKETAHLFAEQGARMVVIADIQDELGKQVAESIGAHKCTYIHCDVADEEQVKNLVQSTVDNYGQVIINYWN
jgi:NAD(P)-dependent dehydrogenase (short-subunit alcohol dehydrogenase family)